MQFLTENPTISKENIRKIGAAHKNNFRKIKQFLDFQSQKQK